MTELTAEDIPAMNTHVQGAGVCVCVCVCVCVHVYYVRQGHTEQEIATERQNPYTDSIKIPILCSLGFFTDNSQYI